MKVAVIGTGKIGCAITQGLIRSGLAKTADITGVARSELSREKFLAVHADLNWTTDIVQGVFNADVVLLGVKPAQILQILEKLAPAKPSTLYISVAAGVTLANMQSVLGKSARLVRAMPNTPVVVGEGVTAFTVAGGVSPEDVRWLQKMFGALGKAYEVTEAELDAVTALSGSGPAYFYVFIKALESAAVSEGLRSSLAREMAAQTALGAATMLLQGRASPDELIAQVKSKGGTTEAALNVFESKQLEITVMEAVTAAANRARELAGNK